MSSYWHHKSTLTRTSLSMFKASRLPHRSYRNIVTRTCISQHRCLLTLAIETSCDDTSVCILEKSLGNKATVYFHEKVTADTRIYRGIHPLVALDSHRANLAKLVQQSLSYLPPPPIGHGDGISVPQNDGLGKRIACKPDFITATRGPGMRSNLDVGLQTAKGLSVAWQIPLVGVHHMQGHLLTPRLISALDNTPEGVRQNNAEFPFLSLLVSGGHSMLVHSTGLTSHKILAETTDDAVGDVLDKIAVTILPQEYISQAETTMYAPLLENFAFPNGENDYNYRPPLSRQEEMSNTPNQYGWMLPVPFRNTRKMAFSFAGIASRTKVLFKQRENEISVEERQVFAREFMRICFELLASRAVMALQDLRETSATSPGTKTLVLSGGVAANQYFRTIVRSILDVRGFEDVRIVAPPVKYCTDNAAMIGWAGIEMFEEGWESDLGCLTTHPWSLDPTKSDGGILGVGGWVKTRAPV